MIIFIANYDRKTKQGSITHSTADDGFIKFMLTVRLNRHGDSAFNTLPFEVLQELVHGSAIAWEQDPGTFSAIGNNKESVIRSLQQTLRQSGADDEEVQQLEHILGSALSPKDQLRLKQLGGDT